MKWIIKETVKESLILYRYEVTKAVFAILSVHSITKMYRTSTASVVHATLHFVQKSRVYTVHFDLIEYFNTCIY